MVKYLRNAGIKIVCFGEGWENPPVFREHLVDIYCKSHIVLNFCRLGTGFSIRVFQVMGTGAFLLTEYCQDLEHFFEPSIHLDWFRDYNELLEKIRYHLANKKEAEQIGKQGAELVHNEYSWEKIMKQIMNIVRKG